MPCTDEKSILPHSAVRVAVLLCLGLLFFSASSHAEPSREEKIKAALVLKVVKFVNWPDVAANGPVVLCSAAEAGMAEALASLNGRMIGEHALRWRALKSLGEAKGCQVLYQNSGSAVRARGLLTIGDAPDFSRKGGVIGLVREDNRVTLEINRSVARDNGVEIAAPLLELATVLE